MWEEFKKFAFKGNVLDMAVGVMIGSAFTAIVTSLVNDMFMPILTLITGRINFADLKIVLGEGENASAICYGSFIQSIINFLLIAICIFLFVKGVNKLTNLTKKKVEEAPKPAPRLCPYCKQEIAKDATRCPHCTSVLDK